MMKTFIFRSLNKNQYIKYIRGINKQKCFKCIICFIKKVNIKNTLFKLNRTTLRNKSF